MRSYKSMTAIAVLTGVTFPAIARDTPDAVVVTATRQPQRISDAIADMTVITAEEIRQAGQTSLVDLLTRQPGIQSYSSGGPGKLAGLFIRGTNTNQTLVFVDGVRMGAASSGTPSIEQIPVSQIDHIEILRGPASALYGADAVGGVIQIFTKRGTGALTPDVFAGAGTQNTRSLGAGFSGGTDSASYSVRVGYDSTDGIKSIPDKSKQPFSYDPARSADGYRNQSVSGRFTYRLAPGHELGTTVLHTDGRNWYEAGPGFDTRADVSQSAYGLYSRNQFSDIWTSTLRLGESVDDSTAFAPFSVSGLRYKTTQDQLTWQNDIRSSGGTILVALESLEQKVQAQGQYDKNRTINSTQLGWNTVIEKHRLQVNLRNDDNSQFGGKSTGYAGYGYQITSSLRAQVSAGTSFRAPTFNDLYFPRFGNSNLKPESAQNKEAALVWETTTARIALTAFNNRVSDMIVSSASTAFIPQNISHAELKGASLSGETSLGGFAVKANLDHLDARNADTNQVLPRRAREQANLRIGKSSGPWNMAGELTAVGRRYDSATETNPMAGYALVNLFARYAVARDWSIEARANNIFNRQYETAWGYASLGANMFVGVRYAPN
jgi:vitamin B12 transporter